MKIHIPIFKLIIRIVSIMASNSPNLNSASISIQMVMITYIARIFHDLGTEQEEIELVWRHLRNTSMCHELTKRLDSRSWRLLTLDPNRVDSPTFREIVPCACEVLERAGPLTMKFILSALFKVMYNMTTTSSSRTCMHAFHFSLFLYIYVQRLRLLLSWKLLQSSSDV